MVTASILHKRGDFSHVNMHYLPIRPVSLLCFPPGVSVPLALEPHLKVNLQVTSRAQVEKVPDVSLHP